MILKTLISEKYWLHVSKKFNEFIETLDYRLFIGAFAEPSLFLVDAS
jgi:hypothetical protein